MVSSEAGFRQTDERLFMNALIDANDCFSMFLQFTNRGAALAQVSLFYQRMPIRPVDEMGTLFTRCWVWRRYVMARATQQGQPDIAAKVSAWSDDAIVSLFEI